MEYQLDTANIKQSLDALADRHERIARALAQVGYPEERRRDHSFETLVRIVVGQPVRARLPVCCAAVAEGALRPWHSTGPLDTPIVRPLGPTARWHRM